MTPTAGAPTDWAAWTAAIGSVLSFAGLVAGLLWERHSRRLDVTRLDKQRLEDLQRQTDLLESARARKVGGYISWVGSDLSMVAPTVINSSELPIRAVTAIIRKMSDNTEVTRIGEPVILPGVRSASAVAAVPDEPLYLVLEFDDDAGARWRKYSPGQPLSRLP